MKNQPDYLRRTVLILSGAATVLAGAHCSAQDIFYSEGLPTGVLGERPGLTLGRWNFHGGVDASALYNDNVRLRAAEPVDDFIFSISPHVRTRTEGPHGRTFSLMYRPSFIFFLDDNDRDSINHAANGSLQWPMNRLTLGLAQSVSIGTYGLSETMSLRSFRPAQAGLRLRQSPAPRADLVESEFEENLEARDVGDRLTRRSYTTRLSADYELGHRTSLSGNFGYSRSDRSGALFSSQRWTQELWLDYSATERTTVGAGVRIGQSEVRNSGLQVYERPSLRLNYTVTDRLGISAFAGAEWRQFEGGSSGPQLVFGLGSAYKLRESTTLGLNASRSERSSARLGGQNYVQTVVSAGLAQALPYRLSASINGGYLTAEYRAVGAGVVASREDEGYFAGASLNWAFTEQWRFGAFYRHFTNTSESRLGQLGRSFSFDQNAVGINASWVY
jgi:hypothetical protein